MAFGALPKYLVIDDFLPGETVSGLLAYATENQAAFSPTAVMRTAEGAVAPQVRQSMRCDIGLGPLKQPFRQAIAARGAELLAGTGTPDFPLARLELELVAHGDNAFYRSHVDTFGGPDHMREDDYRVVTCVYYFHRQPKAFSGGEIVLHAFGDCDDTAVIEARNNRLIVFPSIARHEVLEVSCPSGAFADSRFAINCWMRKAKGPKLTGQTAKAFD